MLCIDKLKYEFDKHFLTLIEGYKWCERNTFGKMYFTNLLTNEDFCYYIPDNKELCLYSDKWYEILDIVNNEEPIDCPWSISSIKSITKYFFQKYTGIKIKFIK